MVNELPQGRAHVVPSALLTATKEHPFSILYSKIEVCCPLIFLYSTAHGDTIRRIDQNGDLTPEYIYDSFGNEYGLEGTTHVMRLADANPFRYCGEYYDIDTKEYYLRSRRYDPRIGRFTSEDPIFSGSNSYEYCGNNPVNYSDPSGLTPLPGINTGGGAGGNKTTWTEVREVDGQVFIYTYTNGVGYIGYTYTVPYSNPHNTPTPTAKEEIETTHKEIFEIKQLKNEMTTINPPVVSKGMFAWPVPDIYWIGLEGNGKRFGERTLNGTYNDHQGQDIANGLGSYNEIVAAASGTVKEVVWSTENYGYHIIIDHGHGIETLYAHCSIIYVNKGDIVNQNDIIAKIGSTGNSTGPHLHFEVRINGNKVDPLLFYSVNEDEIRIMYEN